MKTIKITGLFCVLILFSFQAASAHTHKADSLKNLLSQDNNDTVKLNSLIALTDLYMNFDLDSTKIFIDQAEEYISQLNPNHSFFQFYYKKGIYFYKLGNYKDAYSVLLKSAGLADSLGLLHDYFKAKIMLANIQSRMGNQKKAISIGKSLYTLVEKLNNNETYINYFTNFALYFIYDGQMDTA